MILIRVNTRRSCTSCLTADRFPKELRSKEIWWFTRDVTAAMLVVKNKSICHHWEF